MILKLCPVAATDSMMSWPDLLLGSFWPSENKWQAMKPCENWSFISVVHRTYHFLLLPFFPLHPINLQHLSVTIWVLFLISFHPPQRSWARQCPGSFFQPQWRWLNCAKEVLCLLLLSQPVQQTSQCPNKTQSQSWFTLWMAPGTLWSEKLHLPVALLLGGFYIENSPGMSG